MSAYLASTFPNRYAVRCDHPGCSSTFEPLDRRNQKYESLARAAAGVNGWQVRPVGGHGSRSAPDLCPGHRTPP